MTQHRQATVATSIPHRLGSLHPYISPNIVSSKTRGTMPSADYKELSTQPTLSRQCEASIVSTVKSYRWYFTASYYITHTGITATKEANCRLDRKTTTPVEQIKPAYPSLR